MITPRLHCGMTRIKVALHLLQLLLLFVKSSEAFVPPSANEINRGNGMNNALPVPVPVPVPVSKPRIREPEKYWERTSTKLELGGNEDLLDNTISPLALTGIALLIGFAAQTFINSMLSGDQGLGAFLSDGDGFQKSGFKPRKNQGGAKKDNASSGAPLTGGDPLPWLKLPRFDYVEVAGQKDFIDEQMEVSASLSSSKNEIEIVGMPSLDEQVLAKLESLKAELRSYLERGDIERAEAVKEQLEALMKKYGFQYKTDG